MRTIDTLNIVADLLSDALAWPQPFVIESQTCGEINAHWVTSTRRLTVCYELAQDFGTLYREFELASAKAPTKQHRRNSKSSRVGDRTRATVERITAGLPWGYRKREVHH